MSCTSSSRWGTRIGGVASAQLAGEALHVLAVAAREHLVVVQVARHLVAQLRRRQLGELALVGLLALHGVRVHAVHDHAAERHLALGSAPVEEDRLVDRGPAAAR